MSNVVRVKMAGVSLADIADLLGHKDLATTQIYAKVQQEHLRTVVGKLTGLVWGPERPMRDSNASHTPIWMQRLAITCWRQATWPMTALGWRRGRDSNPWKPFDFNGFQDRRLKPLGHLSALDFPYESVT